MYQKLWFCVYMTAFSVPYLVKNERSLITTLFLSTSVFLEGGGYDRKNYAD